MRKSNFSHFSDEYFVKAVWLTKIRWIVACMSLLVIAILYFTHSLDLSFIWLFGASLIIFPVNGIYLFYLTKLKKKGNESDNRALTLNINLQISVDFLLLTLIIHLTGGIENPCIIFFVFHMIIGSIILPLRDAFLQAFLAIFLFVSLTMLEFFEIIPHYSINSHISAFVFANPVYLVFALLIFSFSSLLVVYFATTLAQLLRNTQSELKGLNAELLRKDEIKNEYVKRVTHNIKGDLSTINSCLNVVNEEIAGPLEKENKTFISKAFERTNKLMVFVDDLLNLTNMRLSSRYETVDFHVNDLIANIVSQIKPVADEKNISFTYFLPDASILMNGIKVSIHEAVYNVVYNAVKYTPENGKVAIELGEVSGMVRISVSDNGLGIHPSDLPHIFEEFYRAENSKEQEGSGLGLALVEAIVKRHSGKIDVESEINKGTVLTLWLPLSKNHANN